MNCTTKQHSAERTGNKDITYVVYTIQHKSVLSNEIVVFHATLTVVLLDTEPVDIQRQ